jgi:hypothetical protein
MIDMLRLLSIKTSSAAMTCLVIAIGLVILATWRVDATP